MTPKAEIREESLVCEKGPSLLKSLNEATRCSFTLHPQMVFRPALTIYHSIDIKTSSIANELARYVDDLEDEYVDQMTTESVIALMSTMITIQKKAPLVTMALKWIMKNPLEPPILNALLQSIVVRNICFLKVAKIRLAIYTYLRNPEQRQLFDIRIDSTGQTRLRNKNSPGVGFWEAMNMLSFDKFPLEESQKHLKPFFTGAKRLNREIPEKKVKSRKGFQHMISEKKLQDPMFQMEFDERKDKELNRPKQLGYANHPAMTAGYKFGTFDKPENRQKNNKQNDQKSTPPQEKSPISWSEWNHINALKENGYHPKNGWDSIRPQQRTVGIVRAVGFPPVRNEDSSSDEENIPVNIRYLTIPKKDRDEYRAQQRRALVALQEKNIFAFLGSHDEDTDEERKNRKKENREKKKKLLSRSSSGVSSVSSHIGSDGKPKGFGRQKTLYGTKLITLC